jgi:hypothetical protein
MLAQGRGEYSQCPKQQVNQTEKEGQVTFVMDIQPHHEGRTQYDEFHSKYQQP